ncbi:hypothetical protein L3X38_009759 [Prunus dulcis]|uniref:RNA-binding protein Tab2/Atab2 C-terminal domain-containing protein n=1 Tax=Prunus dulcis TaxID=3755 RepID=A0AAD4WFV9_PRUDU|nr:hypothetical protein L3X38_009759 [Prunus dulcis]
MELPENLLGEKWAFVQLPFSAIQEEISSLDSNLVFGASLDLDLLGIEIDDKTLIPGLAFASSRAKPLAGIGEVEASTTMTFPNNVRAVAAAAVKAAPPNNSDASSHDDTTIAGPKGRNSSETIQASPTHPLP